MCDIVEAGAAFGASDLGKGQRVQVEYVSANPTGPLSTGHGRQAVLGDCIARLLEKDPMMRPQDGQQLLDAIAEAKGDGSGKGKAPSRRRGRGSAAQQSQLGFTARFMKRITGLFKKVEE